MQRPSTDPFVGQIVQHYQVERLLGRGSTSAVYLAQHLREKHVAALITFNIPDHLSSNARSHFLQRFLKEAAMLITLRHPHLLPIYAYGEHGGSPYLVTPYTTHGSLATHLKQQGRCSPELAQEVLEQVAAGLSYAHRNGVIHGMLKPSNILLSDEHTWCLAGLGLRQMLQMHGIEQNAHPQAHLLSVAGTFLITPDYLAPEVVQGQLPDVRSDVYGLGSILFELLSGRLPFTGANSFDGARQEVHPFPPSLRTLCPDIPVALESVINQAIDSDPAQRFQEASMFAEAVTQVIRGYKQLSQSPMHTEVLTASDIYRDERSALPGKEASAKTWQLVPPIVTGKLAAVNPSGGTAFVTPITDKTTHASQPAPPGVTGPIPVREMPAPSQFESKSNTVKRPIDAMITLPPPLPPERTFVPPSMLHQGSGSPGAVGPSPLDNPWHVSPPMVERWNMHMPDHQRDVSRRPRLIARRQVVVALTLCTTAGAVAAGTVVAGKMNLIQFVQRLFSPQKAQPKKSGHRDSDGMHAAQTNTSSCPKDKVLTNVF